jgi:hypothetical protein
LRGAIGFSRNSWKGVEVWRRVRPHRPRREQKLEHLEPDANNPDGPSGHGARRRAPPLLRGLGQLRILVPCAPARRSPAHWSTLGGPGQFRLRPHRPGQSEGQQAGEGRKVGERPAASAASTPSQESSEPA